MLCLCVCGNIKKAICTKKKTVPYGYTVQLNFHSQEISKILNISDLKLEVYPGNLKGNLADPTAVHRKPKIIGENLIIFFKHVLLVHLNVLKGG